jgi:hypothetical protein
MEKFAVMFQPDSGARILAAHPVLKRLPVKYAQRFLPYLSAQVTEMILDTENNEELGCMIDVPGFFHDWDKLSGEERERVLKGLVRKLRSLRISILCFPLAYAFLNAEEVFYLENQGITLLDGFRHRLTGMLLAMKQLLYITKKDVPVYETCVWGADTDIGRVWVEAMAGDVNHMCIGGQNPKVLENLADKVLRATGLSCQITDSPEVCLSNKHIAVLAEPVEIHYPKCQPSIHFQSYPEINFNGGYYGEKASDSSLGIYSIEMGWMGFPQDLAVGQSLQPWEELGVLEGLIYIVSKVYRDDIRMNKITLGQMQRLSILYEMYPIKLHGFVQNGRKVHFDRFRMDYFRKRRHGGMELDDSTSKNST